MKKVGIGTVVATLALAFLSASCGNDPATTMGITHAEPPPGGPQKAPIVMMHGMAGFTTLGPWDYFYGVKDALTADGYPVFFTKVDPFQSVEVRAQEAATQIDQILAQTGARRVHLIAHSQGGLDARYLISNLGYGDRVATLTTIATPHHGSRIADIALGIIPGDAQGAIAALGDLIVGGLTATNADLQTQVQEITHQYCDTVFNPGTPDDPRVSYYSVGGVTQPSLFVDPSQVDVVGPELAGAWVIDSLVEGDNDGLVPVESAKWGTYLGTVPADHLDEIGWVPGIPQPAFDSVAFYRKLAAFLEADAPQPTF